MDNDLAFLIINYQNNLRAATFKNNACKNNDNSILKAPTAKTNPKQALNRMFRDVSSGELEIISNMTYLHKLKDKSKVDVVINPVARLRNNWLEPTNHKPELKSRLKLVQPLTLPSVNENKENDSQVFNRNDQGKYLDFKHTSFGVGAGENLIREKKSKKVSILVQTRSKETKVSMKKNNTIIEHSESKEHSDRTLEDPNSSELIDDTYSEPSDKKKKKVLVFKRLSDILTQFPDEVEPMDFFMQHSYVLGAFSEFVKENYIFNTNLKMHTSTAKNGIQYTSVVVQLTDLVSNTYLINVPFSLAYFLLSIPPIAQLCFIHNYVINYLKKYKQFDDFVDMHVFLETLGNVCGIEKVHFSVASAKSHMRKSLFGNANLNTIFGDKEGSSGTQSQIITNFDENLNNSPDEANEAKESPEMKNIGISKQESASGNRDVPMTELIKQINVKEACMIKKKEPNDSTIETTEIEYGNATGDGPHIDNDIRLSTESDETSKYKSQTSIDSDSEEEDDKSSNSSSSDDSDESDSLNEEQYTSKNPFEIKYSKVLHKFKTYEIKIIKPFMSYITGQFIRELEATDLQHIFNNDIDHENHPFGDLDK